MEFAVAKGGDGGEIGHPSAADGAEEEDLVLVKEEAS